MMLEWNIKRKAVLGVSPGVGGGGWGGGGAYRSYRYVPPKGQGSRFGDRWPEAVFWTKTKNIHNITSDLQLFE